MLHKTTGKPTWRSLLDDIIKGLLSFVFRKEFTSAKLCYEGATQGAQQTRGESKILLIRTRGIYQQKATSRNVFLGNFRRQVRERFCGRIQNGRGLTRMRRIRN